ncbi:DNA primase [Opitutus terrae]|uniref:DNA primase n=1 Tax=Opitutus terrae (strain DSM 11246 / JCM 15787 / PB90-1) TaxID=452637 RepID=B1ZQW7_OPITP|nr:DNA primase [Opitutus terrae]ACB77865.1 DNA primase [Opitutus terrae PB90-1]
MPVIKPSCVRDLKLRINLADVVSRVVALRKAGGTRLKGLCPFHNEKTPSFHVDPEKGFYKCFGCGKAGDVITFVRETEQLNFTEAVEALGKRFSIVIEYEEGSGGPTREERSLRQELFDLHDVAAEHFHQAFKAANPAGEFFRTYWTEQRRFPAELADEFKIGGADASGSGLAAVLLKRRYSEEALRRCGLFFIYEDAALTLGALRPRFRGRLMIPIRDHQGRVVAFTARQTKLTPEDDPAREAKYVNSPETPIFTKGNLLFNLDRARTNVGEGRPFVLVEGQLDALRCWSVGLKTAIAPQGTSITESQLVLLRRYHPQVECFFDSDSAGQKAALRFLPMALKAGLEVRFLTLVGAEKLDPDVLFLERGLPAYEEVRRSALSAMAFACHAVLPNPGAVSAEQKSRAAQSVFELIAAAESEVARSEFLAEASAHLRLSPAAMQKDYQTFAARQSRQAAARPANAESEAAAARPVEAGAAAPTCERDLLLLCLHYEQLGKPLCGQLPHDWIDPNHLPGRLLNRFLAEFENDTWPGRDHLDVLLETDEERALVAGLIFDTPTSDGTYKDLGDPLRKAEQALTELRRRALEPQLREIELALATGRADSNSDPISLLKTRSDIQRQLRQPIRFHGPA